MCDLQDLTPNTYRARVCLALSLTAMPIAVSREIADSTGGNLNGDARPWSTVNSSVLSTSATGAATVS
jgi:hypothetical protein